MKDLPIQNDVKLLRLAEIIFNGTRDKSESFPKCKFSRGMWAVSWYSEKALVKLLELFQLGLPHIHTISTSCAIPIWHAPHIYDNYRMHGIYMNLLEKAREASRAFPLDGTTFRCVGCESHLRMHKSNLFL